jgi:hypothetical protein
MKRCTTPTITIKLKSIDTSFIDKILITYTQNDKIMFQKRKDDVTMKNNTICFELTEEETRSLQPTIPTDKSTLLSMDIKCKIKTGKVIASDVYKDIVEDVLSDEVMNE